MPHWKCAECHHEWDSARHHFDLCDWCYHPGLVLEEKTAFERFLEGELNVTVEKDNSKW